MSDQDSIFNGSNEVVTPKEADPQPEAKPVESKPVELPEELAALIGEGKKYANPVDALKSIPHAQSHISTLEAEAAKMREEMANLELELEKRKTAEELVEKLNKTPEEPKAEKPSLSPEQVAALVKRELSAKEEEAVQKANTKTVVEKMTAKFGSKEQAEAAYVERAQELGFSLEYMNTMVATHPKAALELFGINEAKQEKTLKPIQGDVNLESKFNIPKPVEAPSVMAGATTKDLANAWLKAGEGLN